RRFAGQHYGQLLVSVGNGRHFQPALRRPMGQRPVVGRADADGSHGGRRLVAGGHGAHSEGRARGRRRCGGVQLAGVSRRIHDAAARSARMVPHFAGMAAQPRRADRLPEGFGRRRSGGGGRRTADAGRGDGPVVCAGMGCLDAADEGGSTMTGTLRRIAVMTGLNTRRTFSSFGNWLWILIVPIAFSLILGFFFLDSESQAPAVERGEHAAAEVSLETPAAQSLSDAQRQTAIVVYASPRGDTDESGLVRLRMTFAVYMVFAFAALFSRSGALHQEYAEGTLQRTVAGGVAYGEIVAAHVAAVFLVGLVQAAVVVTLTSLLGTPWLMAGWGVLALTIGGTLLVAAGL